MFNQFNWRLMSDVIWSCLLHDVIFHHIYPTKLNNWIRMEYLETGSKQCWRYILPKKIFIVIHISKLGRNKTKNFHHKTNSDFHVLRVRKSAVCHSYFFIKSQLLQQCEQWEMRDNASQHCWDENNNYLSLFLAQEKHQQSQYYQIIT